MMNSIQPDPPDPIALDKNPNMNYLKALAQIVPSTSNLIPNSVFYNTEMEEDICLDKAFANDPKHNSIIVLTEENKARLHCLWAYSVIIKLT